MEPTYSLPEFHWHPDVWAVLAILAIGYWWAERRYRPLAAPSAEPASGRKWGSWYAGVFVLWLAAGWPIHDLAEQTLFSFHMFEHMLIGYVVPPLLLNGMPRWMADRLLGNRHLAPILRRLAHPVAAFFAFNLAIVGVHWPEAVAWQNTNEILHLSAHALLFVTGIFLWLPVFSPTPEVPRLRRPMQILYLVLNTIIPTIPASFLTFSDVPLYPVYGNAALDWGLSPVADQTIAGIVMKLGGGFYLLGMIAVIWFRWIAEERRWDTLERDLIES